MELLNILEQNYAIQFSIIVFMGLFIGSFLNVVNYRLPLMEDYNSAIMIKDNSEVAGAKIDSIIQSNRGINLSFPSSSCTSCNHKIRFYENIPVISWIILKGKCSSCKAKISAEYPIVEFLHASVWVVAFLIFGFNAELLFILPLISMIFVISVIDLKHKVILGGHAEIMGILGLAYAIFGYGDILAQDALISGFCVFSGLYIFIVLYEKIRRCKDQMMGRGDFYIFGAFAIWLGFDESLILVFYSTIIGLMGFLIKYALEKMSFIDKDKEMPFAPSICIAFLLIFFDIIPKIIN